MDSLLALPSCLIAACCLQILILPARMSGAEKRERMALMEAAISTAMNHPNIVQVGVGEVWGEAGEGRRGG